MTSLPGILADITIPTSLGSGCVWLYGCVVAVRVLVGEMSDSRAVRINDRAGRIFLFSGICLFFVLVGMLPDRAIRPLPPRCEAPDSPSGALRCDRAERQENVVMTSIEPGNSDAMGQGDTVSGSSAPHPLILALESGAPATEVLSGVVGGRLGLAVTRQGALSLTPEVYARLGNPDTMTPYRREGFLEAVTGPHKGECVAVVVATVLLHRLPAPTRGAVVAGEIPLGTLVAPLGVWRKSWGVRALADPLPVDTTPALASSATLFLGAVPVAYVTEEIPGWVAALAGGAR